MKKSEFCEKEFEILFCREFLNLNNCDFFFPSQRQEVRLGFDALFVGKKFKAKIFQFKVVSEYIKNPFGHSLVSFGFPTHRGPGNSQNQHNTLVNYNRIGLQASYLVPCFITWRDLQSFVKRNSLLTHCRSLTPIHPLSAGNHTIKFDAISARQYCDEAEDIETTSSFSLEDSPVISYNELQMYSISNEKENLFDSLTKNKMVMLYKLLP